MLLTQYSDIGRPHSTANMLTKLLLTVCVFCAVSLSLGDEKYTTKYDNINVDEILGNKRVLTNYIKCILDEGPCTSEGKEFKSEYPQFIIRVLIEFIREREQASFDANILELFFRIPPFGRWLRGNTKKNRFSIGR